MSGFFDVPGGPELPVAGVPGDGGGGDDYLPLDGSVAMTDGLVLAEITGDSADNLTIFANTNNGKRPTWKDASGSIFDLTDGGLGLEPV